MSTEPNDYFNNGRIEMIRFGRHIIMKNNSSIKQQESLIKLLKKRYTLIKRRVDKKVNSIRKLVCKCDVDAMDEMKQKEIAKYITKPEDVDNMTIQDLNRITMMKMGFVNP